MPGFLNQIHRSYRLWKAAKHRLALNQVATIGEEFCTSATMPPTSILSFRLDNRSADPARVRIGRFCNLSASVRVDESGYIKIGDYVYWNTSGHARIAHGLKVGSRCMFGPHVTLWDTDSHPLSRSQRRRQAELIPQRPCDPLEAGGGPISIGDDVWLCMGVLVLGGVSIGDGTVVAARSVVTRDLPAMALAAGTPARVISQIPE